MQKTENPIILAVILCAITGVIALLLSLANNITKDITAKNAEKEAQDAMRSVLHAESYEEVEYKDENVKKVFIGKSKNNIVGYCINVTSQGFGGEIDMMVGIDTENKIKGIKIISLSETPGLGSKVNSTNFTRQFEGKSAENEVSVIKSGTPKENEIVAVSGATVSSKAVKDGVNHASRAIKSISQEGTK